MSEWNFSNEAVRAHTLPSVNRRIDQEVERRLTEIVDRDDSMACQRRLRELESEWEVERALTALIGVGSIAGTIVARRMDGMWWLVPAIGGLVLLEQSLTGGSLLLAALRRIGLRTRREIDLEKFALKGLRGDFLRIPPEGGPKVRANAALVAAQS